MPRSAINGADGTFPGLPAWNTMHGSCPLERKAGLTWNYFGEIEEWPHRKNRVPVALTARNNEFVPIETCWQNSQET
jgi:hypothetical protein